MKYLALITLFLVLFCTPSHTAVFPLIYPSDEATLPEGLKKYLPMLETKIPEGQRKQLSVYAYEKLTNIPLFNESGWVVTLLHSGNAADELDREPYTNPENLHSFFLGESGRFKSILPLYLRFFIFNPNINSLALVQIAANGHPGKRFDGDSLFIDDLISHKHMLSLYDRDDIDEFPSNTYSQLYFYNFDSTESVQIFQHEITFSYKKDSKGVFVLQLLKVTSKLYVYENGIYNEKAIDKKQTDKYFSIIESHPDIMACETFPRDSIQPADFRRLGIETLHLKYNCGNDEAFPSE